MSENPVFDHSQNKIYDACGITQEEFDKACNDLPDKVKTYSEAVELLVSAGDDVVKNAAIVACYFQPKSFC